VTGKGVSGGFDRTFLQGCCTGTENLYPFAKSRGKNEIGKGEGKQKIPFAERGSISKEGRKAVLTKSQPNYGRPALSEMKNLHLQNRSHFGDISQKEIF